MIELSTKIEWGQIANVFLMIMAIGVASMLIVLMVVGLVALAYKVQERHDYAKHMQWRREYDAKHNPPATPGD